MTNLKYNEWLDVNYLSAEYPTEEEMEMLKEYYKIENVEFEVKSNEELPF